MCGIVAMFGEHDGSLVRDMMARIRHRGPDGEGVARVGQTILGHVRLAILDIAGGHQPMANERGDLLVVFNGEIYNHLDLRRSIEARHCFKTRSDTEVLLHLYEEMGEDMLACLDGMFAFALAGDRGLLLARDAMGIKPLYYGRRNGVLHVASELKAFPRLDQVEMLPAGHYSLNGESVTPFVQAIPAQSPVRMPPLEEAMGMIRTLLDKAVVKRLMSDVPVGVFLSGGLDSSLVAALMRPHTVRLHSFTAGMEGSPDLSAARIVADFLGTEHHEVVYSAADVERFLPEIILALESFDAPLVRSAIPMFFVARLAAQHVKVVLMGEGADELFAGYEYLRRFHGAGLKQELAEITIRLQDTNLQRGDRITMAHGLEGRVPFLDRSLVRYVSRLPADYFETGADRAEKWLLRESCRGLLPEHILERKKMKFSEGAGSAEIMADYLASRISVSEFMREREIEPGLVLRSPEELHYYRLWREVMPWKIPTHVVGRTRDRSAAALSE